jgi:glycosyltransferase involved in cell wall biosynthesis
MDKKRKIVYLVGGLLYPNGMCRVLSQKVNWLAEHTDYEVYMILTEKAGAPWYYHMSPRVKWVNFDINFDELDTMPLFRKLWHYWHKQRRYRSMFTNYLMEVRPDITVCTVRREINFITHIHDGSKKIGELHVNRENYRNFESNESNVLKNLFAKMWMQSLVRNLKRLDRLVVLTEKSKAAWPELSNVVVIPDPLPFTVEEKSSLQSKRVITIGRYTYQKGYDMLLKAWSLVEKQHPDWTLAIYGMGDRKPFEDQMHALDLDKNRIQLSGPVDDVSREYLNSSVFVLTSRFEGFGLVIIEAMSCGVPVVAFSCKMGPDEIITNGEDGYLVSVGDVDGLANQLCSLIENQELRNQFGTAAYENSQRYSIDKVANQWKCLFDDLVKHS